MDRTRQKQARFNRRRTRVKNKIKRNDNDRLRLCISRSNKSLYAQIIDDLKGGTVVAVSTLSKDFSDLKNKGNIEAAKKLGKVIADKAKEKGLNRLYFDRNGFLYHGKIKAFADSARENGLDF
ncbi:MAG: 50S ribosomal protein L18 [Spirochaetes bacterium]|nr:50S ribosomal protein L18 [Spirochaetota bacterium]